MRGLKRSSLSSIEQEPTYNPQRGQARRRFPRQGEVDHSLRGDSWHHVRAGLRDAATPSNRLLFTQRHLHWRGFIAGRAMIEILAAREIFHPHADWRNALPSHSPASLATLEFRDLESIHHDKIPAFDCLHA